MRGYSLAKLWLIVQLCTLGNGQDVFERQEEPAVVADPLTTDPNSRRTDVRVQFRVSNVEGIENPEAIKAAGLDASFPILVSEVVAAIEAQVRSRQLREGRKLRVVAVPGTAIVDQVQQYPCPVEALPATTCLSASGLYQVAMSDDEDEATVSASYTEATQTAVDDGTYNALLQRVEPSTPLYIGIITSADQIPPGSVERGFTGEGAEITEVADRPNTTDANVTTLPSIEDNLPNATEANITFPTVGGELPNVTDVNVTTSPTEDDEETPAPSVVSPGSTVSPVDSPIGGPLPPGASPTAPPVTGGTPAPVGQGGSQVPIPSPNATVPTLPPATSPPGGPAVRQEINVQFVVSNLDGIEEPTQINASGLGAAWPVFVQDVVEATESPFSVSTRRLRQRPIIPDEFQEEEYGDLEEDIDEEDASLLSLYESPIHSHRRRLTVDLEPGSAYIYDIVMLNECPGDNVNQDAICHNTKGKYTLLLRGDEDPPTVKRTYGLATVAAIEEGQLNEEIKSQDPNSPLVTGTIEDSKDDGGLPTWAIVLIVLLCVLLCPCCIIPLYFWWKKNNQKDDEGEKGNSEPYEEEGFAYDFLVPADQKVQTEVDDDDEAKNLVQEDEETEDDKEDEVLDKAAEAEPVATIEEEIGVTDDEIDDDIDDKDVDDDIDDVDLDETAAIVEDDDEIDSGDDGEGGEEENEEDWQDDEEEDGDEDPDGVRASTMPQNDGSDPDLQEISNEMEESGDIDGTDDFEDENSGGDGVDSEDDWEDEEEKE